jgi:hypothetical protein
MPRVAGLFIAVIGFALGFVLLFTAEVSLSPVARSIWLVPGLALVVSVLLGLLPSYRAPESRVATFFFYGAAVGLAYIYSSPPPVFNSLAERVVWLMIPLLWFVGAFACLFVLRDLLARTASRWLLLALGMGVLVAYFSGSAGGTGGGAWDRWIAGFLGVSLETAGWIVILVRKTAHFVFYGLFAWVAYRAAATDLPLSRMNGRERGLGVEGSTLNPQPPTLNPQPSTHDLPLSAMIVRAEVEDPAEPSESNEVGRAGGWGESGTRSEGAGWLVPAAVSRRARLFAISLAMSHALFDELRQTMTPDRTGQFWDLLFDLAGALFFVYLASAKRRRHASRPAQNA